MEESRALADQGSASGGSIEAALLHKELKLSLLLDRLWLSVLLLSIFGLLLNMYRVSEQGWLWIYRFQFGLVGLIWLLFALRSKFSYQLRVGMLLGIFYVIAISSFLAFGLLSAGPWYMIIAAFLAKIFYSGRASLLHMLAILLVNAGFAFAYISGYLQITINGSDFARNPGAWIGSITTIFVITFCIFSAVQSYQDAITRFLRELALDNEKIRKQAEEIKLLRGLLPICAGCKNIRNDEGFWVTVENYITEHSDAEFSHSVCPVCGPRLYGDVWRQAIDKE